VAQDITRTHYTYFHNNNIFGYFACLFSLTILELHITQLEGDMAMGELNATTEAGHGLVITNTGLVTSASGTCSIR